MIKSTTIKPVWDLLFGARIQIIIWTQIGCDKNNDPSCLLNIRLKSILFFKPNCRLPAMYMQIPADHCWSKLSQCVRRWVGRKGSCLPLWWVADNIGPFRSEGTQQQCAMDSAPNNQAAKTTDTRNCVISGVMKFAINWSYNMYNCM